MSPIFKIVIGIIDHIRWTLIQILNKQNWKIFHFSFFQILNWQNHLVWKTFFRISVGHPLDSTGHPVGFYWTSTRILQVCFKCLRIANFINKCNNFYWTSSRISIGRLLESTGRPVELLYRTSPRAEDLAEYLFYKNYVYLPVKYILLRTSTFGTLPKLFWRKLLVINVTKEWNYCIFIVDGLQLHS